MSHTRLGFAYQCQLNTMGIMLRSRRVTTCFLLVLLVTLSACTRVTNSPPKASFTWERTAEGSLAPISFDGASSYDTDGKIVGYKWTFDHQNSVQYGMTADHVYPPGTYYPTLRVTDNDGATDTTVRTIVVESTIPLPPTPTVGPDDFVVSGVWFSPAGHVFLFGECVDIYGSVRNTSPITCGVELEASAYDATGLLVGRVTFWPASTLNIPAGASYPIDYFIHGLTIPSEYVARVAIRPIQVRQWQP